MIGFKRLIRNCGYLLTALSCCLGLISNAHACSLTNDYVIPTNLELVEMADLIIIGRVDSLLKQKAWSHDILIKPITLLKGDTFPQFVVLDGQLAGEMLQDHQGNDLGSSVVAYHSAPYNITSHHPEAGSACSRYGFAKDMNLVLFLKKNKKGFDVITPPFTRALEDVPSLDAPWVKAVKHYITISRLPKNKHLQAMKNVAQYYRNQPPSLAAEVLADLFESETIDCAEGYKNNKEKCQYFSDKFYAIADQGIANYETRKAKPAPYEPELLRSLSGLLLLFAFFALLIFLSFGRRKNPMKNN